MARAGQASRAAREAMVMNQGVALVDLKTFKDIVEHNHVVVVDFFADWCGPCKAVAPMMEKLAGEYEGKVKFTKLDVDDSPSIADQFGIMSIPTLIVFKNGKAAETFMGAAPAEQYREIIERALQ